MPNFNPSKYAHSSPAFACTLLFLLGLVASTSQGQDFGTSGSTIGNLPGASFFNSSANSTLAYNFSSPSPNYPSPNYSPTSTSPIALSPRPRRASRLVRSPLSRSRLAGGVKPSPSLSSVPDMFGDFLGGRPANGFVQNGLPPRGGVGTRSVKLAENLSPQPRTRTSFSYHFFNDVFDGSFGDVNRYSFGFELANESRTRSIDIRMPLAHTISNVQINERSIEKDTELGNATIILKQVLFSNPDSLISGGLGVAIPTAADGILLRPGDFQQILRVENDSVHLLPFLGFLKELGPSFFTQGFLQLDVDPSGNKVFGDTNAINLRRLGVVQDPTLLFVDLGVGYRVFENRSNAIIKSMSIAAEIHYATTVQDADILNAGGFTVGDSTSRFDVLNFTVGTNLGFGKSILRPGVVVPLRTGNDRQFDYEVFLQLNHYF